MSKLLVLAALVAAVSSSHLQQYLPPRPSFSAASAYSSSSAQAFASASARAFSGGYENNNNGDGTYRYSYDTPTGISAHESGSARAAGAEGAAVTSEGAFSYRAPDGQQISLSYTADENGFHPVGAHLPTPPPIPEAILRSIEFNRRNPSNDEGSYGNNYDDGGYRY